MLDQPVQHTTRRVGQPALHPALALLLQVPRHTRQRPARARRADERVELAAVCLLPYFRTRREDVGAAVRLVVELVRPDGVVERVGVSLCLVVVVLRVVECDRWYELSLGKTM